MGVRRWRFISPPSRSRRWAATVPTTVSYRSITDQSFGMFAGDSKGQRFQLTSAATLKALCFSNSTNISAPFISGTLALYADAAGPTPGALIASGQFDYVGSGRNISSKDVVRVAVAPVALAAGFYWVIFFVTAASGLNLPAHDEVGISAFSRVVDLSQSPPPPDPFPAVTATPYFFDIFAETKIATGPTTWTGSATLALTDTTTTSGVRKTFSNSVAAFTDTITTSVKRKTFSSSVTALTDTITTAGSRKTLGQSVVALTDAITTAGSRKTFGQSVFTETDNITTAAKRTTRSSSVVALTANIASDGEIRAVLSTLLLYDDASSYSAGATITDHTMWVSGTFPLDGHNDVSQISSKWWTDSGFAVEDSGWIYSRKPTDWGDKYFFRLATQLSTFRDFAVHWSYKSAAYGADGYVVEGSDATEVWLRKTTQYNTYIIQIDHQDGRIYCKRKVPYDNTGGPLAAGIANKGIYYSIPTNANAQPYPSSNYSLYTGAGYATPPGDLAHDSSTVYQFKAQIETVGANVRIRFWRLVSGTWLLIGDWTDDGRIGIYYTGTATQGDHVDAGYFTGISGYGVYWNTNPITAPGGSGIRADNIKLWVDNFRVADLVSGNVRWGGSSTLAATATSTTAGVVTTPTAGTDAGTGILKLTPTATEIREQSDASTGTLKFTPSGTDTLTPTVVELGTYRGAGSTTTGSVTIPAGGVSAGHTVILAVCAAGDRTFTVSDGRGNVYATDVRLPNAFTLTVALISARITTPLLAGDTITITLSTAGNFAFGAYDVATLLSPAFDKSASAIGTGTTADSGTTATTTQADELLFAVQGWNATSGTYTVMDNTWARPPTDPLITTVTTIRLMGVEYKNVAATGAYNATGTYSGASTQWAAAIGTYKFGTGVVNSDTGTGILLLSASASDVSDRVDSNTGVLAFSPSSSEVYTPGALIYSDAATGVVTFTPSAAEIRERVDSATVPLALSPTTVEAFAGVDSASVPLVFSLTSADVFVGADAATEVFALTPSGTDIVERTGTDAATGIVSLVPLSSEVFAAADSAIGTLSLIPSATDAGQRVEVGSVSIVLAASSNDVFVATDSGTSQLALTASAIETTSAAGTDTGIEVFKFTPSASEAAQTTDAATTPVALLPSGTEFRVVTDANAASLNLTPSAAETQLTVDTATALVTFSPSPVEFFTGVDSATAPVVFLPSSSEGRESVDVAATILALSPGSIDVYERVDVATALLRFTPDSQEAGFIFFDAATVYLSLSGHAILFELSGAMRRIYGARIRHRLGRSGLYRPINSRLSRVYSGGMHD